MIYTDRHTLRSTSKSLRLCLHSIAVFPQLFFILRPPPPRGNLSKSLVILRKLWKPQKMSSHFWYIKLVYKLLNSGLLSNQYVFLLFLCNLTITRWISKLDWYNYENLKVWVSKIILTLFNFYYFQHHKKTINNRFRT